MFVASRYPFALFFGLALLSGCSSSPLAVYPVTGTVTYDNKPVEGAQVLFQAEGAPPAQCITNAEGKFTLKTSIAGEGAVVGTHKVTIMKMANAPGADPNDPYAAKQNILPPQYSKASDSPLSAKVTNGTNDFPFVLTK